MSKRQIKSAKHKSKVCKKQIKESRLFTCTVRTIWGLGGAQVKVPLSSVASYQIFFRINNCIFWQMDETKSLKCTKFQNTWRSLENSGSTGRLDGRGRRSWKINSFSSCSNMAYWMDLRTIGSMDHGRLHICEFAPDQPRLCWPARSADLLGEVFPSQPCTDVRGESKEKIKASMRKRMR